MTTDTHDNYTLRATHASAMRRESDRRTIERTHMTTAPKPATPLQVQELTSIRLEADRAKASAALTVALQQNTALLAERAELIRTIQTLVNLTSHPYFPPIKDLPAWDLNVMALRVFLAQTRDEQRIGGDK